MCTQSCSVRGDFACGRQRPSRTGRDAKRLFPRERWNDLHLQIIYYGREYCPARGFSLDKCIITRQFGRKSFINEVLKEQEKKLQAKQKKAVKKPKK